MHTMTGAGTKMKRDICIYVKCKYITFSESGAPKAAVVFLNTLLNFPCLHKRYMHAPFLGRGEGGKRFVARRVKKHHTDTELFRTSRKSMSKTFDFD
jgi:hypothetical protein